MRIILNAAELAMAERYAILRREINRLHGTTDQAYIKGKIADLVGVKGEMAASLATGIPWETRIEKVVKTDGWPYVKMADLGTDIEVRTTRNPRYGLNVLKHNPADWRYVLVELVSESELDVIGWQYGETIKQKEYWREFTKKFHTYSYPRHLLRPIGELK